MARHYTDGDRVHGGVLKVEYLINCAAADDAKESCPRPTLKTGTTTIACGEQEGGVLHYKIAHLKGKGPLNIKLVITGVRFEAREQEAIERINNQYRP